MTGRTISSASKRNRGRPAKPSARKTIAKGTPGSQEKPIQLSDDDDDDDDELPQKNLGAKKKAKAYIGDAATAAIKASPGQENRLNGKDARRRTAAKGERSGRTKKVSGRAKPEPAVLDICSSSEDENVRHADPSPSIAARSSDKKRDRRHQADEAEAVDSDVEIVKVDSKGKALASIFSPSSKRQRHDGKAGSQSHKSSVAATSGRTSLKSSSAGRKPALKPSPVAEKPSPGGLSAGIRASLAAGSAGKGTSLGPSSVGERQSLGSPPVAGRLSFGTSSVAGTPSLSQQTLHPVPGSGRLSLGAGSSASTPGRKQPRSSRRRRKTGTSLARGSRSIESFLRSPISLNTSPRKGGTPGSVRATSPSQQVRVPLAGSSLDLSTVGAAGNCSPGLGLVRVENPKEYSTSIPAGWTPCRLKPKAILGRTDNTSPASASTASNNNRVDLGIDNDADGVSRRQLRVHEIHANHIVLRLFKKSPPTVRGFHFETKEDGTTHLVMKKHKNYQKEFRMNVGDVIQFDTYTRKDSSGARHKFRLVRMEESQSGRRNVFAKKAHDALAEPGTSLATPQRSLKRQQGAAVRPSSQTPARPQTTQPKPTPRSTSSESSLRKSLAEKDRASHSKKVAVKLSEKVDEVCISGDDSYIVPGKAVKQKQPAAKRDGSLDHVISLTDEEDSNMGEREKIIGNGTAFSQPGTAGGTSLEPPPTVGDKMKQDFEVTDMFRSKVKECYFGTVLAVKKVTASRYQISLRYDDGVTAEVEWPDEDLLKLPADCGDSCNGHFSDPNPQQLHIGDLVDCRYQDGKYNGGARYRGRVASISDDGKTIDVAYYDDGTWETGIPLKNGNVHLISRGSFPPTWLLGLRFEEPRKRGRGRTGKVCDIGEIEDKEGTPTSNRLDIGRNERTMLSVQFSGGKVEPVSYATVVDTLFSAYRKDLDKSKFRQWPGDTAAQGKSDKVKQDTRKKGARPCSSATENNGNIVSPDDYSFFGNDSQEDAGVLNMSQESFSESQTTSFTGSQKTKEIHTSLVNMLWRALNSAEPHVGAGLLQHNLIVHKQVPTASLRVNLLDFLKKGPTSEGISLRDPNRVELTGVYIQSLLTMARAKDVDMESAPSMGFSTWEDVEEMLLKPVVGVETKKMLAAPSLPQSAYRKMTQTLQLAAWGLCCTREMFQSQLNEAVEGKGSFLACEGITVRAVHQHGIREALKLAVRTAAQSWLYYGPWVITGPQGGENNELLFASEAQTCVTELGKITCYFAWMFCKEEGTSLDANSCSFVVRDTFLSALEGIQSDMPRTVNEKRLKLQFVLSLSEDFAAPLQPVLAKMLDVETEWSILNES